MREAEAETKRSEEVAAATRAAAAQEAAARAAKAAAEAQEAARKKRGHDEMSSLLQKAIDDTNDQDELRKRARLVVGPDPAELAAAAPRPHPTKWIPPVYLPPVHTMTRSQLVAEACCRELKVKSGASLSTLQDMVRAARMA
jgi:hypothetical protein